MIIEEEKKVPNIGESEFTAEHLRTLKANTHLEIIIRMFANLPDCVMNHVTT